MNRREFAYSVTAVLANPAFPQQPAAQSQAAASTTVHSASAKELFLQAIAFKESDGLSKDEGRAAQLYLPAAEQSDAAANFDLALLYEEGSGVRRDTRVDRRHGPALPGERGKGLARSSATEVVRH